MTPERWQQLDALYGAVKDLTPAERSARLEDADRELRSTLEAILAQDGSALEHPAWEGHASLLRVGAIVQPGMQLGPYKIEQKIGEGGMGEVYRATDTRLARAVAIKTCSLELGWRFQREARAIASLNHRHICSVYDVGPNYLVMELIEGETLAEKLKRGRLSLEHTLRNGAEIADALAAAHAKGVVHRDMKPGNVMLTKTGAKVLDFGLAKSPQDANLTGKNVVMGTPAYMAPEQREGKECDTRTDIYALGLILHEMATGARRVSGENPSPAQIPEKLDHVVERCLAPDPEDRWQSAADVRSELLWAAKPVPTPVPSAPERRLTPLALTGGLVAALAILGVGYWLPRTGAAPAPAQTVRFRIPVPEGLKLAESESFSLSPDRRFLAYLASDAGQVPRIWVQPLDALEPRVLPGTEVQRGDGPIIWSPDSKFLAFESGGKLKKIDLIGSPPRTVCTATAPIWGGAWSRQGVIIFGSRKSGMLRVPEGGGEAVPLTMSDETRGELTQGFPTILPDGRHFLYSRFSGVQENSGVYLGSLDAKPVDQGLTQVVASSYAAQFVPLPDGNGNLLFLRDGAVWSQEFNTTLYRLTGEPVKVAEPVGFFRGRGSFAASLGGALVYRNPAPPLKRLAWFDREGKRLSTVGEAMPLQWPIASPDGARVALRLFDGQRTSLWMYDLTRHIRKPLTDGLGMERAIVWSRDGKRLVFSASRGGRYDLYQMAADETSQELLYASDDSKFATSWSNDGRFLMYETRQDAQQQVIDSLGTWILPLGADGKRAGDPTKAKAIGSFGAFSPAGRWIAYVSGSSGTPEVYVQEFEPGVEGYLKGPRIQVSRGGGTRPSWRFDGEELFYYSPQSNVMSVAVAPGSSLQPLPVPKSLFRYSENWVGEPEGDGKRFLFAISAGQPSQPFTVVLNWQAELKK